MLTRCKKLDRVFETQQRSSLTAVAFVRLVRTFEGLIASCVQWDACTSCSALELFIRAWTWLARTVKRTLLTRAAYTTKTESEKVVCGLI